MHDFVSFIFSLFSRAVLPALAAMIVGAVGAALLRRKRRAAGGDFPISRTAAIILLMGYLVGLISLTLLQRSTGDSRVQLHLFRAFSEAWNAFTLQIWLNPLLNIAMFVPLGVLLPLTAAPFRRWYWTLAAGMGGSLAIETFQYILVRGSADVDDFICNTLGTMLGYCLCMLVVSLVKKKGRLAGAYAALPVLSAAALAGVFIVYQLQPYGNLADAPAFAANTHGTKWVQECKLSDVPETAGIYWVEPFTTDSCDTFAVEFLERQGAVINFGSPDVNYYDNTTMYSDHHTYNLIVNHNDRSYEYTDYRVDDDLRYSSTGGTATEAELHTALDNLGVEVPEGAEFVDEGNGKYVFRASCVLDDGTLTDGELRCRVAEGGILFEVENALAVSTLHREEPILSEAEAYDRLCQGRFSRSKADMFEYFAPAEVHVTSCELQYLIDSKGFRQPAYAFRLEELDTTVYIPALR